MGFCQPGTDHPQPRRQRLRAKLLRVLQSGEVRFAGGETTRTAAVSVLDDLSVEPTEAFTLQAQVRMRRAGNRLWGRARSWTTTWARRRRSRPR